MEDEIQEALIATCGHKSTYTPQEMMTALALATASISETCLGASACTSVAEQAISNAAKGSCFGCGSIPRYAGRCDHIYAKCPYKQDPEVREAYAKGLQRVREQRARNQGQGNRYQPAQQASAATTTAD